MPFPDLGLINAASGQSLDEIAEFWGLKRGVEYTPTLSWVETDSALRHRIIRRAYGPPANYTNGVTAAMPTPTNAASWGTPAWVVLHATNYYAFSGKFYTESAAVSEAERLARCNPGKTYVVMVSVCSKTATDITTCDLRPKD